MKVRGMNVACRTYGRNYKCLQNASRKPEVKNSWYSRCRLECNIVIDQANTFLFAICIGYLQMELMRTGFIEGGGRVM
jgi:hypothetical protein